MAKARHSAGTPTPQQKYRVLWRLIEETALSLAAKVLATTLLLRFHNVKTGRCNPSIATIARTAGISRRAVFNAIAELRDTGWVTVDSTHGGSASNTNQYGFDFKLTKSASPSTGAPNAPPTGAQSAPVHEMPSTGAPFAHELSKTSGPSGHGVGGSNQRAPDGALAEKNRSAREPQFEQLCRMWVKPDGVNRAKALRAFSTVCAEHNGDDVLASAGAWVARVESRYLPKLELWLENGAWQNQPPNRRTNGQHKRSAAEVAVGLAADEERDDDGGWS